MHDAAFGHSHQDLYDRAEEIEGVERLTLVSVGIDIGSSTSHLLFSKLTLRRDGALRASQFKVAEREVLWSSPILLTPYTSRTQIDFEKIKGFIGKCYYAANLAPGDIDTGAVIITGEALKKENARPISEYFMQESGKFICASAGPHHEALLAAYGSGAVQLSEISRSRVLNVDIGGGTTKISLIVNGKILQTEAINIGARLIAAGPDGTVARIEDAGGIVSQEAGARLALGDVVTTETRQRIGQLMGETLIDVIRHGKSATGLARRLMITPMIDAYDGLDDVDYLIFSGGVSEYIYRNTEADYGDLGPYLGQTVRNFLDTLPRGTLLEPTQGIRATVIGASEYTVQVSGATSFFTSVAMLPVYGLKVVYIPHIVGTVFAETLSAAFRKFDIEAFSPGLVLSLSIEGDLNYRTLKEIAVGIADVVGQAPEAALIVTVEQDVARSLGKIMKDECGIANDIVSIDGIQVGDLDFIDIGKPVSMMDIFPVTVKSLLFSSEPLL